MIGHVIAVVLALAFIVGGLREGADRVRLHRRRRKAEGVFVAREDVPHMAGPGVRSRAGRFRFTTEAGRVVERTSALSSFPGPRPGRRVTIVYDPSRPESTAERAGVHALLFLLAPLGIGAGVAILIVVGAQAL